MTTYAYVGLPGSGKSYSVVENQILPALKQGRRVVTNIPLHVHKIRALPGLEDAQIVEFPLDAVKAEPHRMNEFVTPGSLFVLDEAMRLWPAGEKVNKVPDEFKFLLSEHRHQVDAKGNATQIVIVIQDLGNLGAWACRFIDSTFAHQKLSSVGAKGSFRVDIFQGPVKGPKYPISQRQRMTLGRYKPDIWNLYKSHMFSESDIAGANEKSMDNRATLFKRWGVMLGIPLGVICVIVGLHELASRWRKWTRRRPQKRAVRALRLQPGPE